MIDKERLIEVLGVQTESYDDFLMYDFLTQEFKKKGYEYFVDNGNLYVRKGKAEMYPCVIAHMDTVHEIVEDLTVVQIKDNLTGFNAHRMEQTGIGGDDKVGIYIALECLDKFDTIKAAFFRDEEVGCHGSYMANTQFFIDCGYVLQCDRNGNKDFITVASGTVLSSKSFRKEIKPIIGDFGYSFKEGMMTDVMALKEIGVPVSMANISCGYYNPHSHDEYVNIPDVENCLDMVQQIIYTFSDRHFFHAYEHKQKFLDYTIPFTDKIIKECGCCGNVVKDHNDLHYLSDFNQWVCGDCYGWAKKYDDDIDDRHYEQKSKKTYYDRYDNLW